MFSKSNADAPLRFHKLCHSIDSMRIGEYTDASWGSRPDGTSQGGVAIFLISEECLRAGSACPLVILDWSSKKLVRMCRSSLSAEAQSAANAIDMLEWTKVFLASILWPSIDLSADSTMHKLGVSPVITDSKGLFDASRSASSGLGISEKRTAIEVKIINERMDASCGYWAWTSAAQQVADGLTKVSSRQAPADLLRRGTHALKYDPNFVAGKKQTLKIGVSVKPSWREQLMSGMRKHLATTHNRFMCVNKP